MRAFRSPLKRCIPRKKFEGAQFESNQTFSDAFCSLILGFMKQSTPLKIRMNRTFLNERKFDEKSWKSILLCMVSIIHLSEHQVFFYIFLSFFFSLLRLLLEFSGRKSLYLNFTRKIQRKWICPTVEIK